MEPKDKIKPFLDYLGLKDNINYDTEISGIGLDKYLSLNISDGEDYVKYKTDNFNVYKGELGETRSYLELIVPKLKLSSIYKDAPKQYYLLSVRAYIRDVYKCEICAYTVDFKKWYTNPGLVILDEKVQ